MELTHGEKIKLDSKDKLIIEQLTKFPMTINTHKTTIIPCYFPVGRGNPKRAVEILKAVKKLD